MRSRAKLSQERGATMIEYALLIAFLALLTGAAVKAMGVGSKETFNSTASRLGTKPSQPGGGDPGFSGDAGVSSGSPSGGTGGVGNQAK